MSIMTDRSRYEACERCFANSLAGSRLREVEKLQQENATLKEKLGLFCTCANCENNGWNKNYETCEYAFDPYNITPDCLACK